MRRVTLIILVVVFALLLLEALYLSLPLDPEVDPVVPTPGVTAR